MTQSATFDPTTGLENSTYNIISALDREAKFLHSTIDTYIGDAQKENRPDVEQVWRIIKEDNRKHIKMLRDALTKEAKQEKLNR